MEKHPMTESFYADIDFLEYRKTKRKFKKLCILLKAQSEEEMMSKVAQLLRDWEFFSSCVTSSSSTWPNKVLTYLETLPKRERKGWSKLLKSIEFEDEKTIVVQVEKAYIKLSEQLIKVLKIVEEN